MKVQTSTWTVPWWLWVVTHLAIHVLILFAFLDITAA